MGGADSRGRVIRLPKIDREDVEQRRITITTRDGKLLEGVQYHPKSGAKAAILINSGTGIPQYFYASFAAYLAGRGFGVLTYDYRGIGASAPRHLRGDSSTKVEWGRYDFTAAFARLEREYPDLKRFVFGHSVGGQLMGLMANASRIDAVATYGMGFGYWGGMQGNQRALVWALWHLLVPTFTTAFGYMPASLLGLGVDLPSGVARDWARWGKREDYYVSELGDSPGFTSIDVPWAAFIARDDEVATPENALPNLACYPNAEIEITWMEPSDYSLDKLGHIDFFSRKRQIAWAPVAEWFESQCPEHREEHTEATENSHEQRDADRDAS